MIIGVRSCRMCDVEVGPLVEVKSEDEWLVEGKWRDMTKSDEWASAALGPGLASERDSAFRFWNQRLSNLKHLPRYS